MMVRNLSSLEDHRFDLVVIGGGIFGACAAWEATQRGLSVALIERGDFAHATSANCFKIVHGGMRYLQHGDLGRLRQSARARRTFMRIAPHLVQPLPVVVPTYGHGMKGKEILRLALGIYDVMTFDRNRGISDPGRQIQGGQFMTRRAVIQRYPGIETRGLTGAAVFCDGQMYNPPRLVLAYVKTAAKAGAVVLNYVEATNLVREGNRITGVEAQDVLSGGQFLVRARTVLNAAGPYAEGFLEQALGMPVGQSTVFSRDAYFIVRRPLIEGSDALALPSLTSDPDALLSRGNRHLFLVPWHGSTLVGVWHKVHSGPRKDCTVSARELERFIDEINHAYTSFKLTPDDVSALNFGLVPFGENAPGSTNLRYGHRSNLVDHGETHGLEGLVTLIGVRFTTGPMEACKAIGLICRKLGRGRDRLAYRSDSTRLHGGEIECFEALMQRATLEWPWIDRTSLTALLHNHGSEYGSVLRYVRAWPEFGKPIGSSDVLKAEVIHAVREEMAMTLSDVVLRRTDLGTIEFPDQQTLGDCAEVLAKEVGLSQEQAEQQIQQLQSRRLPFLKPKAAVAHDHMPAGN